LTPYYTPRRAKYQAPGGFLAEEEEIRHSLQGASSCVIHRFFCISKIATDRKVFFAFLSFRPVARLEMTRIFIKLSPESKILPRVQ